MGDGDKGWPSFSAFVRDRTTSGETLVCPLRTLWHGYRAYCGEWGFDPAPVSRFVAWLASEEGVTIKEGGGGRIRRVAEGIALIEEKRHARNDRP